MVAASHNCPAPCGSSGAGPGAAVQTPTDLIVTAASRLSAFVEFWTKPLALRLHGPSALDRAERCWLEGLKVVAPPFEPCPAVGLHSQSVWEQRAARQQVALIKALGRLRAGADPVGEIGVTVSRLGVVIEDFPRESRRLGASVPPGSASLEGPIFHLHSLEASDPANTTLHSRMRALFCPSFSAQVSIPCGLVSVDGVKTLGRQLAEATRPLVLAAAYTSVHRRDENSGDFSAEVCRAIDGAIAGANLEPRSPFACSATSLAKGIISDAFVAIDRIVARVNAGDAADLLLYTLGETLLVDWNGLAKQPEEPTVPVLSQRLANW